MSGGTLQRWRLVLGDAAQDGCGGLHGDMVTMSHTLDWLYGRADDGDLDHASGPRMAGDGPSQLTVPEWINAVHTLFPKQTIERLERDAVEVYGITEVVTDPEVLQRLQPNPTLLKAVLQTKHLMNDRVLALARRLVKQVVDQLMNELTTEVRSRFRGIVHRQRSSPLHREGPLDLRRTIQANLRRYDPASGQLYLDRTYHFARRHRRLDRWQFVIVVDQSGSMLDSTIHAAVTAAIFAGLPGIDTLLFAFDTEVVDLSHQLSDPVATLMSVQLGGGTYIGRAMALAATRIRAPRRAIVVLITDFYEGEPPHLLESTVAQLVAQGTQVLGLAALDAEATPSYDREQASRLVSLGAEVGAMTPGELAAWVHAKVRG